MPYPSDEPDETVHEYVDLDAMPDEALACLLEIEIPNLIPRFGLLPDVAKFVDCEPETPSCAPPPGIASLPKADQLHWHETWDRILKVLEDPIQVFSWRSDKRVIHVMRSWVLVVWADGRITPLRWRTRLGDGVKLVGDTGHCLSEITELVIAANTHMEAIATAAKEQSIGVSEVNTAVNHMDSHMIDASSRLV